MARPRIELQPDEAEELRRRARASTVSVPIAGVRRSSC
jgi:hypothetical protein